MKFEIDDRPGYALNHKTRPIAEAHARMLGMHCVATLRMLMLHGKHANIRDIFF